MLPGLVPCTSVAGKLPLRRATPTGKLVLDTVPKFTGCPSTIQPTPDSTTPGAAEILEAAALLFWITSGPPRALTELVIEMVPAVVPVVAWLRSVTAPYAEVTRPDTLRL